MKETGNKESMWVSDLFMPTCPVVRLLSPNMYRISSSLHAPARSILLPKIKTGAVAICSSPNKLCKQTTMILIKLQEHNKSKWQPLDLATKISINRQLRTNYKVYIHDHKHKTPVVDSKQCWNVINYKFYTEIHAQPHTPFYGHSSWGEFQGSSGQT